MKNIKKKQKVIEKFRALIRNSRSQAQAKQYRETLMEILDNIDKQK